MSYIDDRAAEVEAMLDKARQKIVYGRKYSAAFEVAERIKGIRYILSRKEDGKGDADLNYVERRYLLQTAGLLLLRALTDSEELREVADALDAERNEDPRQANILRVYTECIDKKCPPTVAELREAFVRRFGEQSLPADQSFRKTLRVLGLEIRDDKLGRPLGSPSEIHNRK